MKSLNTSTPVKGTGCQQGCGAVVFLMLIAFAASVLRNTVFQTQEEKRADQRNDKARAMEVGAELAIRQAALDPDAVKFRNVQTFWSGDTAWVCGEFNGKNAFGAYVGFLKYMSTGKAIITLRNEKLTKAERRLFLRRCG